jgi:glycosyltransferase involved in cell wall biosynthesis
LKISIITVTYNCVSVLTDCLNSVASQSHNNIEHVVIDGASTDGTLSLLNSKKDQLSILVSESDDGIYDAMNKGIKIAKGDIIGFLNSDDFYANNEVISKVVSEFKKEPSLDACYADLIYVNQSNTSKIVRNFKSSEFRQGLFSKGWCPPHPTFFVRRSVYERYGNFDLNYRIASDVDLMMRFLEIHKIKSRHIPEVWVKMRMGGTTNKNFKNIWAQNQEVLSSFDKNGLSVNLIIFVIYKIFSRFKQFFTRKY